MTKSKRTFHATIPARDYYMYCNLSTTIFLERAEGYQEHEELVKYYSPEELVYSVRNYWPAGTITGASDYNNAKPKEDL